jgi:hypothetical protein
VTIWGGETGGTGDEPTIYFGRGDDSGSTLGHIKWGIGSGGAVEFDDNNADTYDFKLGGSSMFQIVSDDDNPLSARFKFATNELRMNDFTDTGSGSATSISGAKKRIEVSDGTNTYYIPVYDTVSS